MRLSPSLWGSLLCLMGAIVENPSAFASPIVQEARRVSGDWLHAQASEPSLLLRYLTLDPAQPTVDLELEPFSIFAPDAKITVHGDQGLIKRQSPPKITAYRGRIRGNVASHAFVIADDQGGWRGIVGRADGTYVIDRSAPFIGAANRASALQVRRAQPQDFAKRRFECATERLNPTPSTPTTAPISPWDLKISTTPRR